MLALLHKAFLFDQPQAEGRDVKIVGLPPLAVGVLTLMCPNLVALPESVPQGDVLPS